jgi:hypothetical protein
MATIIPDPPSPPADHVESSKVPFDDPEADVILCSHDSQTFCVLKLYISRHSTVLGDLIRAASDTSSTANVARNQERLPEVKLSEYGAILSSLLTFTLPVTPVLPSTLDSAVTLAAHP